MANDNEAVFQNVTIRPATAEEVAAQTAMPQDKRGFLKDAAKGLVHVLAVIWQVPAARGFLTTQLVRLGVPGTLIAIGVAVGEKLAQ